MPSLETFKKWVRNDWRAHREWRREAREAFAFVAGDQWTEEEKSLLEEQNRVPIVFNRTATIINSVVGSEINNRTEVRYFPRTLGDSEINEVLTKGGEWFRDRSGAEEEETQSFYDTVVCGLGWVESLIDFDTDEDGAPMMERIDPLEMCWDASASRRGLSDAHRIARVREIGIEDAKEMFPDADVSDLNARWMDQEKDPDNDDVTRQWSDDDYAHGDEEMDEEDTDGRVTIVQLQYRARRKEIEYSDPMTGKRGRMGKREWKRLMDMAREMGHDPQMKTRDVTVWEWKQAILGDVILEENDPCPVSSTFCPITGYWDNSKRQWFGLVRQMKDPQKYANKWLSQTLHIINANAKGGIMYEEDATDDPRDLEEQWAAADSAIKLRPGALAQGKVQPKPMAQMPAALMSLTEFAIQSIRDVSGVNMELLGLRDQNQPGVLEYQRKQSAMTTLAVLFDALRQYRKQQGTVMLYYMTEYLADGRLIRISDEDGERYEPLKVDPETIRYDVIVDDAPSSPNNKERVWEIITSMMPILVQAGLPAEIWGEIVEYAPFPAPLIEKLKEHASKGDQPDPMAQQMQALAIQKLTAEIDALKAEGEKDRANAFENIAQGQFAMTKAQAAPYEVMQEAQKDAAQADLARAKMGFDGDKAFMDAQLKLAQLRQAQNKPQS